MAGLVANNMARPQGQDLSVDVIKNSIKMPPKLQQAYDRVVVAGLKIMFDKTTHQLAMKAISGNGPISKRVGKGIAGLVATLYRKSNNTIPPEVIVPATVNLVSQACDYMQKTGQPMSNQDIGDAMDTAVRIVMQMFGADPTKMLAAAGGKNFNNSAMQQQQQAPQAGA